MSEYHVSPYGNDCGPGTAERPFRTIGRAARLAMPGDTVTVHEGEYREQVAPARGGTCERDRIVYRAADGEGRPVIKGSERIGGWARVEGHPGVWTAVVDNVMFGGFNPFERIIAGDWLEDPQRGVDPDKHLGDVYLNGRSLFEAVSPEATWNPPDRAVDEDFALKIACPVPDPDWTRYVWHARVDRARGTTTIWANFHDHDPNEELVEISVRQSCFFPSRHHVDYITVRGFEMAQATGDWAPPTSAQIGMVGPNWAYGWIIEGNDLHDAKFSAVSLGKEISTGDNEWARTARKTGYQYQLEAVFKGLRVGWRRGVVGSHLVRGNDIHDCGQNGIVGHMGCAFSRIERNRVRRIGLKREFFGWEVAGIKFHAALDTVIEGNDVHDCSLGMWLDWQTQGVRISRNVFHRNIRDLMIEVSHGPYLVDDNIFASPVVFQNWAQGGAFVNNLICGSIEPHTVPDRSTPYHFPHTTEPAGCAVVSGGDERYVNNLFAPQWPTPFVGEFGLAAYRGHPASMGEYLDRQRSMWADPSQGGGERNPLQPLYAAGNMYLAGSAGAGPCDDGDDSARALADLPFFGGLPAGGAASSESMPVAIEEREDGLYLECDVPAIVTSTTLPVASSDDLGTPRIVEERYEQADGTDLVLDRDLLGRPTGPRRIAGPLAALTTGRNSIRVWPRPESHHQSRHR